MNMKTTFRHDNKKKKVILFALIILVSIFVLMYGPVRSVISKVVYSVAPGVWRTGGNVSNTTNSFLSGFRNNINLSEENRILREQVSQMEIQILERDFLVEEVIRLEEVLGSRVEVNRVRASVLHIGQSPYDTIVVDSGIDQGVEVKNLVVGASIGIIGEVTEVYSSSSKIKLFSSQGVETQVIIGGIAIPTVAIGRGMGNFEAKVPQGSNITVGEEVLLFGNSFALGVVGLIEEAQTMPFARVLFRTSFNITELRFVEIIINKK